jgi:hypothetical protein
MFPVCCQGNVQYISMLSGKCWLYALYAHIAREVFTTFQCCHENAHFYVAKETFTTSHIAREELAMFPCKLPRKWPLHSHAAKEMNTTFACCLGSVHYIPMLPEKCRLCSFTSESWVTGPILPKKCRLVLLLPGNHGLQVPWYRVSWEVWANSLNLFIIYGFFFHWFWLHNRIIALHWFLKQNPCQVSTALIPVYFILMETSAWSWIVFKKWNNILWIKYELGSYPCF